MAHNIIKTENRDQWLAERTAGIGSSEVGTILGLNPFESPYELWARKKGIIPRKEENFAMRAGHYLEDAVSKFFADETGADIIKSSAGDWLCFDPEHPWRRVSPDRTYWESASKHSEQNKRILECKTTQLEIDPDYLPKHWFCQLQYQLGVAEMDKGALAWLTQGRNFGYQIMDFDEEFFGWMMQEVDKFYFDHIIGDKEPDVRKVSDLMIKYPKSFIGKTVEAIGTVEVSGVEMDIIQACNYLRSIKTDISGLEKQKKEIEDAVKLFMGDAEALTINDCGQITNIVTWKTNKSSIKVDTKAMCAENPELAERYSHEVAGNRVFLIK